MKSFISIRSTIIPKEYGKMDFISWYLSLRTHGKRKTGQYITPNMAYKLEYSDLNTDENVCRDNYRRLLEQYYKSKVETPSKKTTSVLLKIVNHLFN